MSSNRESLKNSIVNLYGEVYHKKVRSFEDLRKKRARLLSSLAFLKRCRDSDVLPKCVQLAPKTNIWKSASVLKEASKSLLKNLIVSQRYKLSELSVRLLKIHLDLASVLSADLFSICDSISFEQAQRTQELCTTTQTRKLDRLTQQRESSRTSETNINKAVVNVSSHSLTDDEVNVLTRGLNFAVTPRRIPFEDVIGNVEECISRESVNKVEADEIRQDVAVILRRAKTPTANVTNKELSALKSLRENSEIVILPADKGNATVVLDTNEYTTKVEALVADDEVYERVNYDPTNRVMRKVTTLINEAHGFLPSIRRLRPACPIPPKLYGLPKIHKEGIPLRPVVSQISSPTYFLAKHIANVMQPLVGKTSSYVKDSQHFVEMLQHVCLDEDEILVSFDVESLFTNVPVQECLQLIKDLLPTSSINEGYYPLIELCLTSGYFLWNREFYLQIDGVNMGSPISPIVANIWMEYFEQKAISTSPVKPKVWLRYVDDTFCIINRNDTDTFLNHLNSVHPSTKFTMERENDGALAFLDVKVLRRENNTIGHTVYRKPTHTDKYLHATSHHHPTNLRSVVSALINRAHRICDSEHLQSELSHVDSVLEQNGYSKNQRHIRKRPSDEQTEQPSKRAFLPYMKGVTDRIGKVLKRHNIKTIFRPPKKIGQYLRSVKDKVPLQTPGVYAVPCSCGLFYIGQTKRSIQVRLKEHVKSIQKQSPQQSAICEHLMDADETDDHWIRFDQVKVLSTDRFMIPRLVREAIEIKRHKNFNRDDSFTLSSSWTPVLNNASTRTFTQPQHQERDTVSIVCRQPQQQTQQNTIQTQRYNLRSRLTQQQLASVGQ